MIYKLLGICLVASPLCLVAASLSHASPIMGASPSYLRSATISDGHVQLAARTYRARHPRFKPGKNLRDV